MRSFGKVGLGVLVVAAGAASAGRAQDAPAPAPSFYDAKADRRFGTYDDHRKLIITDSDGGIYGVFDPLFGGDDGREGVITSIRAATPAEMRYFKHETPGPYVVLNYSAGGLLVISTQATAAVRPRHCDGTAAAIVSRNIACRIDLRAASERETDAMIESSLGDGRSTITPIEVAVPCAHIVIHVDADGRTVWATGKSGKRLWTEDPFERAGMKPHRLRRPVIHSVSPFATRRGERCGARRPDVGVSYNSTQFGALDSRTGKFTFGGQD